MAEIVRAAVQVQVDQPAACHVPEHVAFAAVDHQVDAGVLPELRLVRVPELPGPTEEVVLRLEGEEAVVVHATTANRTKYSYWFVNGPYSSGRRSASASASSVKRLSRAASRSSSARPVPATQPSGSTIVVPLVQSCPRSVP